MIMVQFPAILHIEQASQVIQAPMVTAVAMALVMGVMVTATVDMEVTTPTEELMEGQVITGIIKMKKIK